MRPVAQVDVGTGTYDVRSGPVLLTAVAAGAVVVSVMPVFLLGAFGVLLMDDLDVDAGDLGLLLGSFFMASALSAVLGGRLVERWGPRRSLAAVTASGAVVLLSIAALAQGAGVLAGLLVIGGVVNGLAQPASNVALAGGPDHRQGLMFGAKQAAIPVATLLAGAAVPVIGLTLGWRWGFVVVAVIAVPVALMLRRLHFVPVARRPEQRARVTAVGRLITLSVAMGVGTAAATALGGFLVPAAVAAGVPASTAGWMAVVGSVSGVLSRLLVGWYADRRRGGGVLHVVALMLALGAVGLALLSVGQPGLMWWGAVMAYSCGWGWTGLMMLVGVRLSPHAPAAASGILQAGGSTGAALGPVLFGMAAETSFLLAWWLCATAALLSSLLVLAVMLAPEQGAEPSSNRFVRLRPRRR